MKSLAIVLLLAIVSASDTQCDIYRCVQMFGGQCANATLNNSIMTYNMQSCTNGKICDLQLSDATPDLCATNHSFALRYPGEVCLTNAECFNANCTSGTCLGAVEAEYCDDDSACGPALYCEAKKCVKVKAKGESCTTGKCDVTLVCSSGVCKEIGGLAVGAIATAPAACKTFFVNSTGVCDNGPTLVRVAGDASSGPTTCSATKTDCAYKYSDGSVSTPSPCICGRTASNTRYCVPGKGDVSVDDVRTDFANMEIVHRVCEEHER